MAGVQTLLKRSGFLAAARDGAKFVSPSLVMQIRNRGDEAPPRLGLTTSRKVGNAVTRNRARRRMRSAARLHLAPRAKCGHDYVLIARYNTASRPWEKLTRDLGRLLAAAEKKMP